MPVPLANRMTYRIPTPHSGFELCSDSSMGVGMGPDVTSHVNKDGGCKQSHVTRLMTFTRSDVTRWREI